MKLVSDIIASIFPQHSAAPKGPEDFGGEDFPIADFACAQCNAPIASQMGSLCEACSLQLDSMNQPLPGTGPTPVPNPFDEQHWNLTKQAEIWKTDISLAQKLQHESVMSRMKRDAMLGKQPPQAPNPPPPPKAYIYFWKGDRVDEADFPADQWASMMKSAHMQLQAEDALRHRALNPVKRPAPTFPPKPTKVRKIKFDE